MRRLLTSLALVYTLSLAAMLWVGIPPAIPWAFLPYLATMVIPFAYVIHLSLCRLERRLEGLEGRVPPVAMLVGLAIVGLNAMVSSTWWIAAALLVFFVLHLLTVRRQLVPSLCLSLVALLLIYGSVWNMNYVLGATAAERRHDALVMPWDVAAYSFLFGRTMDVEGLYPLGKAQLPFRYMEAAYMMLFVQVFVVLLTLIERRDSVVRFLTVLLVTYLAAGPLFYVLPVVAPYFDFPKSLHADFRNSTTGLVMQSMVGEYGRMIQRETSNGFGYIIGLPSLHVAMAVVMQRFLACSRVRFWAFLPINVLLIVSTVYLGYHYLIDVPAGLLHAAVILAGFAWWERRGRSPEAAALRLPS